MAMTFFQIHCPVKYAPAGRIPSHIIGVITCGEKGSQTYIRALHVAEMVACYRKDYNKALNMVAIMHDYMEALKMTREECWVVVQQCNWDSWAHLKPSGLVGMPLKQEEVEKWAGCETVVVEVER